MWFCELESVPGSRSQCIASPYLVFHAEFTCVEDVRHKGRRTRRRAHVPLPCVTPRRWLEYPNMSFRATSAVHVNSSSRTSLSVIVPRRAFSPAMTAPTKLTSISSTSLPTTERTLELSRGNDLNCHDGFEDDGLRLIVDLTEGTNDGQSESKFGRVDRVRETILQDESGAADRVARQCALLQCLKEALYSAL